MAAAMRGLIGEFFKCAECRDAFVAAIDDVIDDDGDGFDLVVVGGDDDTDAAAAAAAAAAATAATTRPLRSKRDLTLWLWRHHNDVTARVAAAEATHDLEDPLFKKAPFPTVKQCPACRKEQGKGEVKSGFNAWASIVWDEDAVYAFMNAHYAIQSSTYPQLSDSDDDDDDDDEVL
jgi:hypothetical protein